MHIWAATKTSACRTNSVDSEMCVRTVGYVEMVGVYRYLGIMWTIQVYQKVISTLFSDVLVSQVLQIMIRSRGVSVSFSRGCSCWVLGFRSKLLCSCGMDGFVPVWSDFFQSEGSMLIVFENYYRHLIDGPWIGLAKPLPRRRARTRSRFCECRYSIRRDLTGNSRLCVAESSQFRDMQARHDVVLGRKAGLKKLHEFEGI
jgi:hypothetical protein